MSKGSEAVKRWRASTKLRMISAFGGSCGICGYSRCQDALEFHHINPADKSFSFGRVSANPKSRDKIASELEKCVCLCSICHREVHAGLVDIDLTKIRRFDRSQYFADTATTTGCEDECPICGKLKPVKNNYCSLSCASKSRRKIDWDAVDLAALRSSGMSFIKIAEQLGVSDHAVIKRARKLGIN